MDAFGTAAGMLGDLALTSGQIAQLRAINTKHYLAVHELLRGPDGRAEERDLTGAETATLRAVLVADILEILTPEQRGALPPGTG
jgi:Spy/CpxP family protein refolding chaperone